MRYLLFLLFLLFSITSYSQTTQDAYNTSTLAWNYSDTVPFHSGFRLTVNGVTGGSTFGKNIRSVVIGDTVLKSQSFGPYTINLVATATAPASNSLPVSITINYKATPVLAPPTNLEIK